MKTLHLFLAYLFSWPITTLASIVDAGLPQWVVIAGMFAIPVATIAGVIGTFLHTSAKVDRVEGKLSTQVLELKIEVNHRMDELITSTEKVSFEKGLIEGHDRAIAEAKVVAERLLLDEALRKQGADALLAAQATPAAVPTVPPAPRDE